MIRTHAYRPGAVGSKGGTDAGLVGTPQHIADRMREFLDIGITTFLLQFHPMLEEMQRFGEEVIPLLQKYGVWRPPAPPEAPRTSKIDVSGNLSSITTN